jgi:hypothetical protein
MTSKSGTRSNQSASELPTDDPNDVDMMIGQRGSFIFIWCSCELVMHIWDSTKEKECPEEGNLFVMDAVSWTRDQFNVLIDEYMDGKR